jgi:hypothetical protein
MRIRRGWIIGAVVVATACDQSPIANDGSRLTTAEATPSLSPRDITTFQLTTPCNVHWASGVSGNWTDATKWNPAVVPTAASSVCIDAPGTYTVTLDPANDAVPVDLVGLSIGAATGTQTLRLIGQEVTMNITESIDVLANGVFQYNTSTGAHVSSSFSIKSGGTLHVLAPCGGCGANNELIGSWSSQGTININGQLTQPKPGATYVNTGAINMTGNLVIPATATGASFAMNAGSITPSGNFASMQMNTGTFGMGTGTIGADPGTRPGVQLADATLILFPTSTGTVSIGVRATAAGLSTIQGNIAAGTTLVIMGPGAAVAGSVTFNGAVVNNGTIRVDHSLWSGAGTTINGSDSLTNAGTIAHTGLQTSHYKIDYTNQGTFTSAAIALFDKTGATIVNSGTMTETGASPNRIGFVGTTISNQPTGVITGNIEVDGGKAIGTGSMGSTTFVNGSTAEPGFSPGILSMTAYRPDATATLKIELGGTTPGTGHDKLALVISPTYNGTLALSEINGFQAGICGQAFEIVTFTPAGGTGTFPTVTGANPAPNRALRPVYTSGKLTLYGYDPTSKVSLAPNPASVAEGSPGVPYAVCLDHQPAGNVTVTATPSSQVTVTPASLTFNATNYYVPQFFTVTAVDDQLVEGNHTGIVSHAVTATDQTFNGATATLNVNIADNDQAANRPPVATNDNVTTPEDVSVSVSPLANDSDPDGDALTITSTTPPSHGTAVVQAGGQSIVYTPAANYNGADSFTYAISDGTNGAASATVNVTVSPANDAPAAANDATSTAEDVAKVVSVLANDSDIDGDVLTVTAVTQPAHGTSAISGGGSTVTYTPAANYNGADAFTYTISDGKGGSSTATVNVSVAPVNDAPVATADAASTQQGVAVAVSVLANDSDIDGNALTVTSATQPAHGTTSVTGNGTTVTYTPTAGYTGPDAFSYTISDGNGGSATANVAMTVTAAPNQPPVAVNDAATTAEDVTATIGVRANDSDPNGDPLTVTAVTQPAHGVAAIGGGGTTVTYTPAANYNGADAFTYTISDGNGASSTATVSVTVTPVNDSPVAAGDAATTAAGSPVTVSVLANDSDIDGDVLSVASVTQPANGSATISGSGTTVTYTPAAGFSGQDSFGYTVRDPSGLTATATVTVTVAPAPTGGQELADLDLAIVSPDAVPVNGYIRWRITETNNGPLGSSRAKLVVKIPAGLRVDEIGSSFTCITGMPGVLSCMLPALPAGASRTDDIWFFATRKGSYTVEWKLTGQEVDPNPANNTVIRGVTVK